MMLLIFEFLPIQHQRVNKETAAYNWLSTTSLQLVVKYIMSPLPQHTSVIIPGITNSFCKKFVQNSTFPFNILHSNLQIGRNDKYIAAYFSISQNVAPFWHAIIFMGCNLHQE